MLPLEVYRSAAVQAVELDRIFGREWLCIGRTADVPNTGDWFTAELPGPGPTGEPTGAVAARSIIVLRDEDGMIRAFDNVCIHRGAELVGGCGSSARFTCPYHAWVYRLDGQLTGGPYMQDSVEADGTAFEPDRYRLASLPVEIWEGFVFVSQAPAPAPLSPTISGLTDVVGRYVMADYVPVFSTVDEWDTNWKLLVENFMDAYHVFKVHKDSFGVDGDNTRFTTMHPGADSWAHHRVMNPADSDFCSSSNTTLEGEWRKTIVLGAVFPGFVVQLQPDWLWYLRITPLDTGRCRIHWQVAVAPDVLADQDNPEAYTKEVMDLVHQVNSEDLPIVEALRRNAERPQFARGPLSYLERNVYDFDRYIARHLAAGFVDGSGF